LLCAGLGWVDARGELVAAFERAGASMFGSVVTGQRPSAKHAIG